MGCSAASAAELGARQAITEVIHRYCRGMDRMDKALTLSCWHPGGTDDHAPLYAGSAEGFVEWLWPVHAEMLCTRHVVSNILIDVRGHKAGAESYWSVTLRIPRDGQVYDVRGGGRYVDEFECIDGVWAIRHRQSLHDWDRVDRVETTLQDFAAAPLVLPNSPEVAPKAAARDLSDYSYRVLGRLDT